MKNRIAKIAYEVNFDGLVGPSHHYGGLSYGNLASKNNEAGVSDPKAAAKQGLMKMKRLADLGFKQAVLPPLKRPALGFLNTLGFTGDMQQVISNVAKESTHLLSTAYSASSMWTANAATVSPSADTQDGRVHFTPANLNAKTHRSIEHEETGKVLSSIFSDSRFFKHHQALPAVSDFGDEGAANHNRLCASYGDSGVELFVYGREVYNESTPSPVKFPARQTREASEAIARLHGLQKKRTVFALQSSQAIDAGVFHNDVIAVSDGLTLFFHECAFENGSEVLNQLQEKFIDNTLEFIEVKSDEVSLSEAVSSYLFNSQLLSLNTNEKLLVVPLECRESKSVWAYLQNLVAGKTSVSRVEVLDLKQSMHNGGGPACLRLRVVLTEEEMSAVSGRVFIDDFLFDDLNVWIERHYRNRLSVEDLTDPALVLEINDALLELSEILELSALYD